MTIQTDLFNRTKFDPPKIEQAVSRSLGLRKQIHNWFRDRKYQTFTIAQVLAAFSSRKPTVVRHAVQQLVRSGHIISTGERRGPGADDNCITLNLHKR